MRPFLAAEARSELLTMGFGAVAFLPLEGVIRLGRTTAALFQQRTDCAGQSPTSNMLPSQQRMPNGFCGHSDIHTEGRKPAFFFFFFNSLTAKTPLVHLCPLKYPVPVSDKVSCCCSRRISAELHSTV